uniref:B3 domain-containing protein At2g33720 family n=3 Tax=Cajanus cajan TaxID=3821 RepID=A0A151S2L2_CAJCA|nr:B3 domain-containing protein At2g33720 family [Cajanus cajan]
MDKVVLSGTASEDETEEKGYEFEVLDVDTNTKHTLRLVKRTNSIVFTGNWTKDFILRRDLKLHDFVGFYWDDIHKRYNFSVLKREDL